MQDTYSVSTGGTAELNVYAEAEPPLNSNEIRWRNPRGELLRPFQDARITFSRSSRQLVLRAVTMGDAGRYRAEIYREVSLDVFQVVAEASIQLNIQGSPLSDYCPYGKIQRE